MFKFTSTLATKKKNSYTPTISTNIAEDFRGAQTNHVQSVQASLKYHLVSSLDRKFSNEGLFDHFKNILTKFVEYGDQMDTSLDKIMLSVAIDATHRFPESAKFWFLQSKILYITANKQIPLDPVRYKIALTELRSALKIEPYDKDFRDHQIRLLIGTGELDSAFAICANISNEPYQLFFNHIATFFRVAGLMLESDRDRWFEECGRFLVNLHIPVNNMAEKVSFMSILRLYLDYGLRVGINPQVGASLLDQLEFVTANHSEYLKKELPFVQDKSYQAEDEDYLRPKM